MSNNKEVLDKVLAQVKDGKLSSTTGMFEVHTKKGTKLYAEIFYRKHGCNLFTDQVYPSQYMLNLQRQKNEIAAFTDLDDPSGAVMIPLHNVNRKSSKQLRIAIGEFKDGFCKIMSAYPNL